MRPAFEETPFACFDAAADESALPHIVIASPATAPSKSFARVHAVECTGSGSFFFRHERLRHRFVCWRVVHHVVLLREWSFHTSFDHNGLCVDFAGPVVPTGILVVEDDDDDEAVHLQIVTHAGTIHRLTFGVPRADDQSIFAAGRCPPEPTPRAMYHDVVTSLRLHEVVTVAVWVHASNVVLGTDRGRVVSIHFGPKDDGTGKLEKSFTNDSVLQWLWDGLVRTTTARLVAAGTENQQCGPGPDAAVAIVAMTSFPWVHADGALGFDDPQDVCVVTVSTDCVLRAWSLRSHSCQGQYHLQSVVEGARANDTATDWVPVAATRAHVVALAPSASANCRLLVHVDTTAAPSSAIALLRGNLVARDTTVRRGHTLALETARIFSVPVAASSLAPSVHLVAMTVDTHALFSSWRGSEGETVYVHANPMALTGPKHCLGQVVTTVHTQQQTWARQDRAWVNKGHDETEDTAMDDFYTARLLLPGRFSRHQVARAMADAQRGTGLSTPCPPPTSADEAYKAALIRLVTRQCDATTLARTQRDTRMQRWTDLLAQCTTHWQCENVPIGFVSTTFALLPGAPLLLRRNRVSLFFPSAPVIAAALRAQGAPRHARTECVAALTRDVLPSFDAVPSRRFQTFIHEKVVHAVANDQVDADVAYARQCVRLGGTVRVETDATGGPAALDLTRSILRLTQLLGRDATFQTQVLQDLVAFAVPGGRAVHSGTNTTNSRHDEADEADAMERNSVKDDGVASPAPRAFFAGSDMRRALHYMAARTIDAMCCHALRVVLLLAFLVDARPGHVGPATVTHVERVLLPRSIRIYERWRLSQRVATLGRTPPRYDERGNSCVATTARPPLLQTFLVATTRRLNGSDAISRARSVLHLARATQSQDAQAVLATFTCEIVHLVVQPHDTLVQLLRDSQHFQLVRALLGHTLRDSSGHDTISGHVAVADRVHHSVRSMGECWSLEGQLAATLDKRHARWCFHHAIRCFGMCLSHFLGACKHRPSLAQPALAQFIYDSVALLKATLPRDNYDQLLDFLWTLATHAASCLTLEGGDASMALHSFVWVNVFKYALEERAYRDAHLALMHTVDLSVARSGSDTATATATARECATCLVKALYREGHLELIGALHWGPLEVHVEQTMVWHAATAPVVTTEGRVEARAQRYHALLFTYYTRKHQPANAASALYALALRVRLAGATSKGALEAQRNALNAACNSLLALPEANRWVVRKCHLEEQFHATAECNKTATLTIVTRAEMRRDVAILDGKLLLLASGHSESILLGTMDGHEVVALLLDAVYKSCHNRDNVPAAQRRRASVVTIEVATAIATSCSAATLCDLTKSLARYCVATELAGASSVHQELMWELLAMVLGHVASLEQYELAAETVLAVGQQKGRQLVLPEWLRQHLSDPTRGNPAKLLVLYLKHGLLSEGLHLVESVLSTSMATIKVGFEVQTKRAGNSVLQLPWIPYNLVDVLLDSTSAVLKEGARSNVSTGALAKLCNDEHSLRQHLVRYFTSVHALQQAHEAANLARSGSELDL